MLTAKRIGKEYHIYRNDRIISVCPALDSYIAAARLLSIHDPADDGMEVDIIKKVTTTVRWN